MLLSIMSNHLFSDLTADIFLIFVDDMNDGKSVWHPLAAEHFQPRSLWSLAAFADMHPGEWHSMGTTSVMSSRRVPVGFEEITLRDQQRNITVGKGDQ